MWIFQDFEIEIFGLIELMSSRVALQSQQPVSPEKPMLVAQLLSKQRLL
jgi:hypothetical protein